MMEAYQRLALPEISGAEAKLANGVYGASGRVRIEIEGRRFRIFFQPAFRAPYRPALRLILAIGDGRAVLDLEDVPLPELLGYPEGGLDAREIPAGILFAYLEGLLGGLLDRTARWLGRPVKLAEAGPAERQSEPDPVGSILHLELHAEAADAATGEPVRARLHLAPEDLASLADALPEAVPEAVPGDPDGAAPALAIRFRFGSADLTVAECRGLGTGDIILFADDPMAKGGILVCAGETGRAFWKATCYEGKITLEEECGRECEDEMQVGGMEAQGSPGAGLEALEVRLTFDLGGRMATLAELRGLAAGSVFELPENPDARVSIRAGGKAIGTGSLIMVDGRAGVRVEAIWEGARA